MKTVILKANNVMKDSDREKLEKELSEKMKKNVVILDGKFSHEIVII